MNVDDLAGPAGVLEALLDEPASPRAGVVFAHPLPSQGGTMHTKAVFQGAKGLTRIGCAVLRFNFRGVGLSQGLVRADGASAGKGGEPAGGDSAGHGVGELDDYKAALDWMAARYPGLPLWAAGFSFGAWIALETGAADPRVAVLIGIAPPVNRHTYSFTQTLASTKPKFLIQGSLDELCPLKEMWAFYAKLKEPRELVVIDGANHLFEGRTEEVGEALADLLGDYE
ncbi:MAG TPA: alpha/beta hydrolase [Vicinamibacterales bacterium]